MMSNVPSSLTDSSFTLFKLAISSSDPWPFSFENKELKDVPNGSLAILVGQGEEQQRFVIPLMHITHPLFMQLLKEAEEEYGFDHEGPIIIPCHVQEFRNVQGMINKEHHHHHVWCFRV
ncbi:Auxin-responsive protein SAUR32 [Hibiscus syriacus]|uniref:Auxin-responsive protein SAUR32 n=1 Tax=Hibiscus syriacus TaxID=106335 RepID=A0A6A2ZS94_HIBSY|nr:Auxin-responsive protein SAUR32 [Hibiscus syriacus]